MDDLKSINDCIHDKKVVSYTVNIKDKKIQLNIEENISIIFDNVLAHKFNHVILDNILFNIEEISISDYIQNNKEILDELLKYSYPTYAKNCNELKIQLDDNRYKIFIIYSSLGLNGNVIARNIQLKI